MQSGRQGRIARSFARDNEERYRKKDTAPSWNTKGERVFRDEWEKDAIGND
jgi:hypothetical protein